eukprot:scaffold43864_cov59-Phaeocystis_antarctica.AAC.1
MPSGLYALGISSAESTIRTGLRPAPTAYSTVIISIKSTHVSAAAAGPWYPRSRPWVATTPWVVLRAPTPWSWCTLVCSPRIPYIAKRPSVVTAHEQMSSGRRPSRSTSVVPETRPTSCTRPMNMGSLR